MNLCSISEIRPILESHGFRFSKALGQNFLIEDWVPRRIAESSLLDKQTGVLEIGPGVGCLTAELASRAGKVVAVELDRRLPAVLAETLADFDNVSIVSGDILKIDIPALADEAFPEMRRVVCANLPYNITTPVLTALIDSKRFSEINIMIQREVAHRLCAAPGTADYGAFSVYVQYYTEPTLQFDVSPGCFFPQPKVTSSVVGLKVREAPPVAVNNEALFFRVVRSAFAQRRKTLLNALVSGFSGSLSKDLIIEVLSSAGLESTVRGETLDLESFSALTREIEVRL